MSNKKAKGRPEEKFEIVMEASRLSEEELGGVSPREGLATPAALPQFNAMFQARFETE